MFVSVVPHRLRKRRREMVEEEEKREREKIRKIKHPLSLSLYIYICIYIYIYMEVVQYFVRQTLLQTNTECRITKCKTNIINNKHT